MWHDFEFELKAESPPDDIRALGEAIYQWYDENLRGELSQYYADHGAGGGEQLNFQGPELQQLRQGNAPKGGRIKLSAYDSRPHWSRAKLIEILQRFVTADLVADVIVDGVTWDKTDE